MRYFAFILAIAFLAVSCHNEQGHDLLGCGHDHSKDDDHNHAQTSTGPNTQHKDEEHKHDNEHEHEHELYGVTHIQYTPFGEVIKSGGEIMPARGDEQVIVANHDGLISFAYNGMQEGVAVKASQQLIALTSGGLVHDNLEVGYLEAKAQFEKAKTDYERAEKLMADTIIAKSEYLDAKLAFEKSQLAFNNIRRNYTLGGQKVLSPVAGFVKAIHVTEGEFVQAGQPLITISQNKRLVIKADVPQDAIPKLNSIRTANFVTPYDGEIYATTDLNGKLISWGKSTIKDNFYIPVFFEIDNKGGLIPGTFIEVYLKTAATAQAIAIPQSALLEEFGSHYVFVDNHTGWEKRYVKLDGTDGKLIRIVDGLKVGEHIATKNVSRIKLAQMSGQLPEAAHVH